VSILAVVACVVLVALDRRRKREPGDLADPPRLASPFDALGSAPSTRALVALAIGAGIGTALFSRPWIGLVVGVAVVVASRVAGGRIVLTAGAPVALALARMTTFDDLGWLAIALLAADLVTEWVRVRSRRAATAATPPTGP
jgi:hypothetical protein